ncbi:MAG: Nif3-like dinuclear metal center hexameric protein [Cyclobacteriaceae bacterium]|nr:Nif3-like dinuclear metal center hexameric protein [Cyclobacteriaceae bacterium]
MTKIKDIIQHLESQAPLAYQEDYDNSGLITGDNNLEISGVLIALDCTEEVIEEAIRKQCTMVIAHHPIVFKGLKRLTGKHYVERTVIKAIKNDIAIYAIHTNLDHVDWGVNKQIADRLGLVHTRILRPKTEILLKLTTFVPIENTGEVLAALHQAGAGMIGNYQNCSFRNEGIGTFLPGDHTHPTIGTIGKTEEVKENRLELIFPAHLQKKILVALFEAHPYEEVAYYLQELQNAHYQVGAGMIGSLREAMDARQFIALVKEKLQTDVVRHTALVKDSIITVAVCGGSGSFLLQDAMAQRADVFISGDFKYHEFFEADGKIIIADVGHYESEQFTKELIYNNITEKFPNIALHFTEVNTNPIFYAYN